MMHLTSCRIISALHASTSAQHIPMTNDQDAPYMQYTVLSIPNRPGSCMKDMRSPCHCQTNPLTLFPAIRILCLVSGFTAGERGIKNRTYGWGGSNDGGDAHDNLPPSRLPIASPTFDSKAFHLCSYLWRKAVWVYGMLTGSTTVLTQW